MKRRGTYYILLLIIFICQAFLSGAQTFKADVDRSRILIGEQIKLTLKLEGIKGSGVSLRNWVELPDSLNHIEVVERGQIDTIEVNNDLILQQSIAITSFDSGQWQLPAFKLVLGNNKILATQPIIIDVLPVDVSHLKDYHDIKDILEVENKYSLWILIGIALLTIISIIVIYRLARKRSGFVVPAKPLLKGNQTPIEWALSQLEKLQQDDLPMKGQVKQYYQQLTDISRQYFELQLKQKALQQTSDEWMMKMQPLPVEPSVKTSFFQFIRLADTVKFAKYLPPTAENDQSIKVARQMLMAVANTQQPLSSTSKTTGV